MRFVALLPVRDEADIIQECLRALLTWADSIYVFDTGSVDETWEIIQALARSEPQIRPMRKEPVYFSETRLRGYMFHVARREMETGDWFARVDADEFHHIPPPVFVNAYLRKHETCVYHQYYNFQLTQEEVEAWDAGKETLSDRKRPIADRRRYFIPAVYSEPRLCRYRRSMQWPLGASFPVNAGFVARRRIPIRHYPHRDPIQMERRCRLRAVMMADETNRQNWSNPELHHWAHMDWENFVARVEDPELRYWAPGTDLPGLDLTNHLRPWHVRLIQRVVHACFLPLLDRLRPGFPEEGGPQVISVGVQQRLISELRKVP